MNPITAFLTLALLAAGAAATYWLSPYPGLVLFAAAVAIALAITNYREAIDQVAQTSLHEMVGGPPADRERQTRVMPGSAEATIAGKFVEGSLAHRPGVLPDVVLPDG
jgi:hypothetical protein